MRLSDRMGELRPGVFARLAARKQELIAKGADVVDLSVGSPDLPPDPAVVAALQKEIADPAQYVYALEDLAQLRNAAAAWYLARFGVELNPEREITSLLGSQEGLAHIALTLCNPGDVVLAPDPCYPIFSFGPGLAGARVERMPMRSENGFLIDFREIPAETARAAKMMIVSYPNNPTGAVAPVSWYRDLVAFAKDHAIVVVHDNAYCELVFDGEPGGSFLSAPGARDIGVELNSLSKTYALAGARVGFCLGNAEIVDALKSLKSNIDYGIFLPVQRAAIAALTGDQGTVRRNREAYRQRRDLFLRIAEGMGWHIPSPAGSMFIWAPLPPGWSDATAFCEAAMERAGLMMVPGESFGPAGKGYVRIALVKDQAHIAAALERLALSGVVRA